MTFLDVVAALVGGPLVFGVIGIGLAANHDGSGTAGFIGGCVLGLIATIFMLFMGLVPHQY